MEIEVTRKPQPEARVSAVRHACSLVQLCSLMLIMHSSSLGPPTHPPMASSSLPSLPSLMCGCHYATCQAHVRSLIQCEQASLLQIQWGSGLEQLIRARPCPKLHRVHPHCRYSIKEYCISPIVFSRARPKCLPPHQCCRPCSP